VERQALTQPVLAPFSAAFLGADPRSDLLLRADFRDRAARIEQAKRSSRRRIADGLLDILREQDRALPASPARRRNLESLAQPETVAVVTGQQMGLFLGPLYTFYKAASAVAVARAIEAESGVRSVPVFWLQTEDHDFPEINHCYVATNEGGWHRLGLKDDGQGDEAARVSVEHRLLGEEISAQLDQLEQDLGPLSGAPEFLSILRDHYRPGRTMSAAFAGVLATLFADEGLILLDPRHAGVARLAAPIYRKCITSCEAIAQGLLERGRALSEAGFEVQVHVRPSSPLVFFHDRDAQGPRFRLERSASEWLLSGSDRSISNDELLRLVEAEPLRFSSSALLRPIIQDTVLPTVAYVGGPGEINYFAQLPPVYSLFGLPLPLIVPRARFRCLDPRTLSLLQKMRLQPADVERPQEEVVKQVVARTSRDYPSPEVVTERIMGQLSRQLDDFEALARTADANLLKAVTRTKGTIDRAVSRLVDRYRRSLFERDRIAADRLDRLQDFLFPEGMPQERFYSLAYFASRCGPRAFKELVLANLVPFATEVQDLRL
jgi:bacillithiol biosynthesis cysteine-adding enzyme BshC